MSKVSIVIPVYNSSQYLPQCLNSLLEQTYQNMEILCVNDGSTDGSLEILEQFAQKDERIRIFTKENEGKGAASARNMGLANATGKYVHFLDSDDFFEPNMFEEMIGKAEETNADVVICRVDCYDDMNKRIIGNFNAIDFQYIPQKDPFSFKDCPKHIFQIGDLVTWNKLYRKELLDKYDLKFESIPISDDQYVPMLALVYGERITCVDKVFLHYRIKTGQSQADAKAKHPEAGYASLPSIVENLKKAGVYEDVKQSFINKAMDLMRLYFDAMADYKTTRLLYDVFRKETFPLLDAENLPENYFYDKRLGEWYKLISEYSLEEILLMSARGYGSSYTTAILRLQLPYNKIKQGSKIVLVGKGTVGKYWYAQIILSDYCEVVSWVEEQDKIPSGLQFDDIINAY